MGGKNSYESTKKYQDKVYDRIGIVIPKGYKKVIKDYADAHNMTISEFMKHAIEEKLGIEMKRNAE